MPIGYFFKLNSQNIIVRHLKEFLNSRAYLKNKNNKTIVFDARLQTSIAEYQKYNQLVTKHIRKTEYQSLTVTHIRESN